MQNKLFDFDPDLSDKRVMIGLSGGINSAALLCYLANEYSQDRRPKKLFLCYSHLKEHSPDTFKFVKALIRYAKTKFDCVTWEIKRFSVIKFFEDEKFIPHPILSPCSEHLKIIPAMEFAERHNIDVDLVGFVNSEKRRIKRQTEKGNDHSLYPISHLTDDDCFEIVKREIEWYPAIYDIRENGKRVFKHNNCLPCKNMAGRLDPNGQVSLEFERVKTYYPDYYYKALQLSEKLNRHWGRDKEFDGQCKFCEEND